MFKSLFAARSRPIPPPNVRSLNSTPDTDPACLFRIDARGRDAITHELRGLDRLSDADKQKISNIIGDLYRQEDTWLTSKMHHTVIEKRVTPQSSLLPLLQVNQLEVTPNARRYCLYVEI